MSEPTPTPPERLARNPPSISLAVNQHEFKWWKRLQSAGIGAVLLAVGGVTSKGCDKLEVVNVAMAQTQATTSATATRVDLVEKRLEAVDSGTRLAIERLERKIDANNEATDKTLEAVQATLQAVLREVKRK